PSAIPFAGAPRATRLRGEKPMALPCFYCPGWKAWLLSGWFVLRARSNHETQLQGAARMSAQFDGFEAGVCYQFGDVSFRPDMVDITGKGRAEPGIFGRTKSKNGSTAWFQHATRFDEVIERCFPEVDGMDSEDLVERLVSERQLVAASEMKF